MKLCFLSLILVKLYFILIISNLELISRSHAEQFLGWGTPHLDLAGVPLMGRNLGPVTGVPPERTWDQLKYYGMEMG